MIKLPLKDYHKALNPLRNLPINTLFAETVVQQHLPGSIYVDSVEEPTIFYICHPYGMSLLFGDTENEAFNHELCSYLLNHHKVRDKNEWLQAYPESWNRKIEELLGNRFVSKTGHSFGRITSANHILKQCPETIPDPRRVVENGRVNFKFNSDTYKQMIASKALHKYEIVRTTQEMALSMPGVVIPKYFWASDHENSLQVGVGFTLLCEGELAATAFSAYQNDKQLEIGIETAEAHRGKGYALAVCAAIVDYCLEHDLEPVWGCRLENEASYYLAQSLGFEPTLTIPYYRLVV